MDRVSGRIRVVDRVSQVLHLSRDATVSHVGFAEYPYHEEQWHAGRLLHPALVRVAKEVWGVDACPKHTFDFFRARGFDRIYRGSAEALWDLSALGHCFELCP